MAKAFFKLVLWHFAHQQFFMWFAATMLGVVVGSPDLHFDPSRFAANRWVPGLFKGFNLGCHNYCCGIVYKYRTQPVSEAK
jgi:hypothetical protein